MSEVKAHGVESHHTQVWDDGGTLPMSRNRHIRSEGICEKSQTSHAYLLSSSSQNHSSITQMYSVCLFICLYVYLPNQLPTHCLSAGSPLFVVDSLHMTTFYGYIYINILGCLTDEILWKITNLLAAIFSPALLHPIIYNDPFLLFTSHCRTIRKWYQ